MDNKEKNRFNPEIKEKGQEALKEAAEQHERLRESRLERAGEISHENVSEVTHEALEKAKSREKLEEQHEKAERQPSPAERRNGPSKVEKAASFNVVMKEVHSQMSAPSRAFSKVIHNKTIERVSEATGNTVARPDAILSGAISAFLLTLSVYLIAKNLGYPLSGFETIGAFILGWVLGLTFDFIKVMVTGRK